MNGTMVDNTVVGGPAYNSKQLVHGDVILEVDGREAKNENIFELLIGCDIPGSTVDVKLAKGGSKVISAFLAQPIQSLLIILFMMLVLC
jgi:S1-C subfamily serine protease